MTAVTGRHCAPAPARPRRTLASVIWDFLRHHQAEEEAAPVPPPGAAMLGLYGIPDGWTVAGSGGFAVLVPPPAPRHASGEQIPCGGRNLGTLPRKRTADRPPWETAQFPAVLAQMRGTE